MNKAFRIFIVLVAVGIAVWGFSYTYKWYFVYSEEDRELANLTSLELADYPESAEKIVSIEVCKGYPEEEILKKAEVLNCDAIIMGAHEKGITNTFLGSVAKRVLQRARKPVFIIPLPTGNTDMTFHDM